MTYFVLHLDAYENGDDKNLIQFEGNYVNLLKSVNLTKSVMHKLRSF